MDTFVPKRSTAISNFMWSGDGPRNPPNVRLEALTDVVLNLEHISGYCYTQLTDVEQEENGIYNYDRSEKFDMDRVHAVFSKQPIQRTR